MRTVLLCCSHGVHPAVLAPMLVIVCVGGGEGGGGNNNHVRHAAGAAIIRDCDSRS